MGMIVLLLGLPALCWLAYRKPLLATVVLSFVAFGGDSIGIPAFLSRHGGYTLALLTRVPILIAAFFAWFHLRRRTVKRELPRYLLWFASIAILGAGYAALGAFLKGVSLPSAGVYGVNTGLLFVVVGLAYARDAGTRRILTIAVALHLLFALLVSLAPYWPLGEFRVGHRYSLHESEAFLGETPPGAWELDRQQRSRGHFGNPHGLAVYAACGVAIGVCLLVTKASGNRRLSKLAGLFMCLIGASGLLLSMGRSELLGLILGAIWGFSFLLSKREATKRAGLIRLIPLLFALSCVAIVVVPDNIALLESAFVGDVREATLQRQEVLDLGVSVSLEYPLIGVPHDYRWPGSYHNVYPHVLPLYYSALFGLPVGAIGFILLSALFWGPLLTRRYQNNRCKSKLVLGGMLAGIILVVTSANNLPAPILMWWCWALAVVPFEDTGQSRLPVRMRWRRLSYTTAHGDSRDASE